LTALPDSAGPNGDLVEDHRMIRNAFFLLPLVGLTLALAGCGETTTSRAGSGALMGAAGGAAIGSLSGNAGRGAAIGAGAGLLGGYLFDQHRRGNID
jgi:hypothetical protein